MLFRSVRQHGLWGVVTSPVVAMGAYFSLIHAVVLTGDRYHLVSAVAIASMAGFAFAALGARAAQGRRDSAVVV